MKTIHIFDYDQKPLKVIRNIYANFLKKDETFHFVLWGGGANFKGHKFEGSNILLRVDEERIGDIKKYLHGYKDYEVYSYPFPKRTGFLYRLGLGRGSIEAEYMDIFHSILHNYSLLSIKIKDEKKRKKALASIQHLYTNIFGLTILDEVQLHLSSAWGQIETQRLFQK